MPIQPGHSTYTELLNAAEKLWHGGQTRAAAETYLAAADAAHLPAEKAGAYGLAGTAFGWSGDEVGERAAHLRAGELWLTCAQSSSEPQTKAELYWQGFLQFVALREDSAQMDAIRQLTGALLALPSRSAEEGFLKALVEKFPDAGSRPAEALLLRRLGELRVARAEEETSEDRRIERLEEALHLFERARDPEGQQRTRHLLTELCRQRGSRMEAIAAAIENTDERARGYELAASTYSDHCPDDRTRCRNQAVELREAANERRREAAHAAWGIPGVLEVIAQLEQILVPTHLAINDGPFFFRGGPTGIFVGTDDLIVRSLTGMADSGEAHERFVVGLSTYCHSDLNDDTVRRLVLELVAALGETDRYCPTPNATPLWYVTTKVGRAALAVALGTITGAIAGVVSGGPDPKAVLVGIAGAQAALIVNLLSIYLQGSEDKRAKTREILEALGRPDEAMIIAELSERPRTIRELSGAGTASDRKLRRLVHRLEKAGLVRRADRRRGGIVWELRQS